VRTFVVCKYPTLEFVGSDYKILILKHRYGRVVRIIDDSKILTLYPTSQRGVLRLNVRNKTTDEEKSMSIRKPGLKTIYNKLTKLPNSRLLTKPRRLARIEFTFTPWYDGDKILISYVITDDILKRFPEIYGEVGNLLEDFKTEIYKILEKEKR